MNKIDYSKLITDYCNENKISVRQLADKLQVGIKSVYRWRDEGVQPSLGLRNRLNALFNIPSIEDTTEQFIIVPEKPRNNKQIYICEDYYDLLKEMSYFSGQKLRHVCEQCIKFAYEHFNA